MAGNPTVSPSKGLEGSTRPAHIRAGITARGCAMA